MSDASNSTSPLDKMAEKLPAKAASNGKLNETDHKIVLFIEQKFYETGGVPTPEKTAEYTGIPVNTIQKFWKKDAARTALIARGIDLNPNRSNQLLDPKQLMLANALLNTHDKRTVREKLKLFDISSQQYHAWMRNPAFSDYLRKRAEEVFKSSDFQAYLTLTGAVEQGDINATMKFFEMRGIYNPKIDVNINVEMVIARVIEVVAKHVTDAATLTAIADEIETIDIGNRPSVSAIGGF